MDFMKIFQRIEENRPLSALASHPVIIEEDGEKTILWFVYDLKEEDKKITAQVSSLYSTQDGDHISEEKTEVVQEIQASMDEPEPEYTDARYFQEIAGIYDHYSAEAMMRLLSKVIFPSMMALYETMVGCYFNLYENRMENPKEN